MTLQSSHRVLIADADPDLRRRLYTALLKLDVYSDTVGDGAAALSSIDLRHYAVVLLDLDLAKADPLLVVERLGKRSDADRPMVLLMASGPVPRTVDLDCVQIVLRKPIDVIAIAEVIQSCIRSVSKERARRTKAQPDSERDDQRPRA